jgi:hypothetical protein
VRLTKEAQEFVKDQGNNTAIVVFERTYSS